MNSNTQSRNKTIRWIKVAVRVIVLALVVWGVGRTVVAARQDFAQADFRLADARPAWLILAGACYFVGLLPFWMFWHVILKRMRQSPLAVETLRAYFVGHLGKYVPGKAMVVVLRTGLLDHRRVSVSVAAASVIVETLTMMAVGALMAAVILLFISQHYWLTALALGLMLVAGVPTLPPVLKRIVRVTQVSRWSAELEQAIDRIDMRLLVMGWGTMIVGWLLLGLSLWATLCALPEATEAAAGQVIAFSQFPLIVACVALAMVAGFLSLIPGGLGVREGIVMSLLEPTYGAAVAVVSAITLRMIWLVVELLVAGALQFVSTRYRDPATTRVTSADCD